MNVTDVARRFGLPRYPRSWRGRCPGCGYSGTFSVSAGRLAATAAIVARQLALIATTSTRVAAWATNLRCTRTLIWLPADSVHPVPINPGDLQ